MVSIKKVAVLGAGVMGAQIAAHCVNAGIETILFDLTATEGGHNAIVAKAIANLQKLKPAPLGTAQQGRLITACNYDDNLSQLSQCDLIIEAIAERLDWKKALYQRIAPFVHEQAVLVSNTSGLSINTLVGVLPPALHTRFCGVHFFNPPRYMTLVELIPAHSTAPILLDQLETWLTTYLGKGVIRAKDTPNFIANRIGVFSLLATLHHAEKLGLGLDEVDALTGTLIGRPKSATCRTMDVVGLDTMQHVVHTMQQQLVNDPWHAGFRLPTWLENLIEQGDLGQKTGQGIYRKQKSGIEVFDPRLGAYRPTNVGVSDELKAIMSQRNPVERMKQLFASDHPQAQFLAACFHDVFHYSAYHLEAIANTTRDIDRAMCWGFGWQEGPFATWQAAGFASIRDRMTTYSGAMSQVKLPTWLSRVDAFYEGDKAYSPAHNAFEAPSQLPVYQRQLMLRKGDALFENEGVCLSHLKDDVAVLHFKSKSNTIGQSVLDGLHHALEVAESRCQGMIIYQLDPVNFSSGANLKEIHTFIQANNIAGLEQMITGFQSILMRMKYSGLPVVAAMRGRALGGGCELALHCDAVVAAFESYPGLVEVGVGVIPAGGGCKELALRASQQAKGGDIMAFLSPYFEQIATAVVAGSAPDAQMRGYLKATDQWVMHPEHVLYAALAKVKAMQAFNYLPPLPQPIAIAGREGAARFQAGLVNWLEGGFISQHDYRIGTQLAHVLCGGDLNQGSVVDEAWMLRLEKEAFMHLAATSETQARIGHMLETGKPLRN